MGPALTLLDRVTIASPCTASWDEMSGDDRQRFCSHCQLHVYNISEMSREAAEDLIRKREGRLCIRMYRRSDGTLLTRDCPVGLARLKRSLLRSVAATVAMLLILNSWAWAVLTGSTGRPRSTPLSELLVRMQQLAPTGPMSATPAAMGGMAIQGDVCETSMGEMYVVPVQEQ